VPSHPHERVGRLRLTQMQKITIPARTFLAVIALALLCAACERSSSPGPVALTATAYAATSEAASSAVATWVAATADAQVEAWAIATGTALRLTAQAGLTPTPPPATGVPGQPPATADMSICGPSATECTPTVIVPTVRPPATATPPPTTSVPITPPPPTITRPTPVPATPSPAATECYNKPCFRTLVSPNGQYRWPETCSYTGIDTLCYITFSNGKVSAIFGWPVVWSADSQFLAVPEGGTHDSMPGGYQIWDMAKKVPSAILAYNFGRQWWAPTGHTLAYVKRLPDGTQEFHLLDAETREDQTTRQCPAWATEQLKISDDFDWRDVCDNWAPPAGQPVILSFTVDPTEASPGQSVTLNWTSINAYSAELTAYSASSAPGTPVPLPPNGSRVITISKDEKLSYSLNLIVRGDSGRTDQRSRSVSLLCLDIFFFATSNRPITGGCPYRPPAYVQGADQVFEHGRMLWLAPLPVASTVTGYAQGASIYVLYNAGVMDAWGVWQRYDDFWTPAQPESDPALQPPAGFYQPVRGFGKIWRDTPGVRDKLGWALAPEKGNSNAAYQAQWRYGNEPGDLYIRGADMAVLYLQVNGYWWQIQP